MERLSQEAFTNGMTTTMTTQTVRPDPDEVERAIHRRSFCTLASVSPSNRPHVAGVLYEAIGTTLYVNTLRTSRKARNIAANPQAGVCIPIRRLPVGPPSSVQFQARVAILDNDDPEIARLLEGGQLRSITGHGELDNPHGCFLRITPTGRINTYGLGMSLRQLLRDPLNAGGSIELAG
jgi:hypothetical protein